MVVGLLLVVLVLGNLGRLGLLFWWLGVVVVVRFVVWGFVGVGFLVWYWLVCWWCWWLV